MARASGALLAGARSNGASSLAAFLPVLSVLSLRGLVTLAVTLAGFSAISDDDFARLVIAQGFAETPVLDPSGTSWLPFPFWLTGAVMKLGAPSIVVARLLAAVTSLLSAVAVLIAAEWAGLHRNAAWLGAALAAVLPHAVWMGIATVPEGYSAALSLLAASSLCSSELKRRWIGALVIGLAALSRYEAWPVAALLCAFGVFDAFAQRDRRYLGPALLALVGPVAWLVHGALDHGDALFFLKRVADYRRALGRSPVDLFGGLLGYPKVLLRAEPELAVATLGALVYRRGALPQSLRRLVVAALAVLAFLVVGDLGDGAPTHHPERPLLLLWLTACLVLGDALTRIPRRVLVVLGVAAFVACLFRPIVTRRDDFIDRSEEIHVGQLARNLVGTQRLVIDTDDYAYFAVMAGFERVSQCAPLRDHDPRRPQTDPFENLDTLRAQLAAERAQFLVVSTEKLGKVAALGPIVATTPRYALVQLR